MSTLKVLKEYLVGEGGYLLNDDNNGKTVMLSGAWGSGKTHFWQKKIEENLTKELNKKNKACVYVSLYGMDALKEIKEEVFFKASKENDYLSNEIEVFGFDALSTIADNGGELSKGLKTIFDLNKYRRKSKGTNKLKDGGIICFDDFERKSKNIDLNDLFGFISQLAIGLNCKVVIILNSDVFEGEEKNVFNTVKEKTVNKFFYFEPTIEELFNSIYNSDEKYKRLDNYKDEILSAIKETEELNARIYISVLDNFLEWRKYYDRNKYEIRALVLITTNFIQNHFVFTYRILEQRDNLKMYTVLDRYYQKDGLLEIAEYFLRKVPKVLQNIEENNFEKYLETDRKKLPIKPIYTPEEFLHQMHSSLSNKNIEKKIDTFDDKETTKEKSENYYERLDKIFHENKNIFYTLYFYAYVLNVEFGLDKKKFDEINQFVQTGILPKKPKEVESSLPPKVDAP